MTQSSALMLPDQRKLIKQKYIILVLLIFFSEL
jgi:hypothetical protein